MTHPPSDMAQPQAQAPAQTNTQTDTPTDLDAQTIMAWLAQNPDFLSQHPEACTLLHPPAIQKGRKIADFQSYMIDRLRDEKQMAIQNTQAIVETSRANMNNQQRIHTAVLRLLDAQSLEECIHTITMDFATILNVDIVCLIVEAQGHNIPHIHNTGVRIVPDGTIHRWMGGKNALLQSNISGIEAIFGSGATLVASQALLQLHIAKNAPPALLAFGSRNPYGFEDTQGTDQALFLAGTTERCLRLWILG